MALFDMADIEPLIKSIPQLLKNGGKFVFSLLHPCFNSGETTLVHEKSDIGGEVHHNYFIKASNYLKIQNNKGIGIVGQPVPQWYFHRPISEYFRICFNAGFCLTDLREPSFKETKSKNIFDNVFINNPPALVCGFKLG